MNSIINLIVEIPLQQVQSKNYQDNIDLYNDHPDTCIICGKRCTGRQFKMVHMLTNGNLVSTDQDHDNSQGMFPIGNDCAKKLVLNFAF